jgi:hypothetical protein
MCHLPPGLNGGLVFQTFFVLTGKKDDVLQYRKAMANIDKENKDPEEVMLDDDHPEFCRRMDNKYYSSYLGFLASTSRTMSGKKNYLSRRVSYIVHGYGLSLAGMAFLGELGLALPQTTYEETRDQDISSYQDMLGKLLIEFPSLSFWWDNYSHFKYTHIAVLARGTTYVPGNFTGLAYFLGDPTSDFRLKRNRRGEVLPCFPSDIADQELQDGVRRRFALVTTNLDFWKGYLDRSYTHLEGITNVPLKSKTQEVTHSLYFACILENCVGMSLPVILQDTDMNRSRDIKCFPVDILPYNVSDNGGATATLETMAEKVAKRAEAGLYSMAVLDVTTYSFVMREFYNVEDHYRSLKTHLNLQLAAWHPGKQVTNKVYDRHFLTIIAPAYIELFKGPCSSAVNWTSLQGQLAFLTALALAYQNTREDFEGVYQRNDSIALHLQQFFEFFLPLVRFSLSLHCTYDAKCAVILLCYVVCN